MARSITSNLELNAAATRRVKNAATRGNRFGLGTPNRTTLAPLESLVADLGRQAAAKREANLEAWASSPYRDLRGAWGQSKGNVGETVTRSFFTALGLEVEDAFKVVDGVKKPETVYDEFVTGLGRVDSKLATESTSGRFQWNNLNPSEEDFNMVWGVTPDTLLGWLIPTNALRTLLDARSTGAQIHGLNYSAGTNSYNLAFATHRVPAWLAPYGGTEDALVARVQSHLS